jgi:hypothetical protein
MLLGNFYGPDQLFDKILGKPTKCNTLLFRIEGHLLFRILAMSR